MRAACRLPRRLQRLLAGPPPRLDGQELAPDMHMLLRLAALAGDESVAEGRSPAQARAENRAGTAAAAGPPLAMETVEELEIPGPAGAIPARAYRPQGLAAGPQALIVYFHGGGWVVGDLDTQDSVCRFLAANVCATVLSVGYRLAPEHPFPAAVDDAFAAFRWAAESAERLDADASRIAVAGDSAGGNLAAAVSLLARGDGGASPAMQVLIYPVTDTTGGQDSRKLFAKGFLLTQADMDFFEEHYLANGGGEDPRVSMLRAEDLSGLPPAYVVTAGFDPLRDEGEDYAERMRAAGVPVALRRQRGLIHGFANMTAISRNAHAAMCELAGAVRMGLAG